MDKLKAIADWKGATNLNNVQKRGMFQDGWLKEALF